MLLPDCTATRTSATDGVAEVYQVHDSALVLCERPGALKRPIHVVRGARVLPALILK